MLLLALTLACVPDDIDTTDTADTGSDTDTETGTDDPAGFPGTWLSEGGNLSPLFGGDPFNYDHIDAVFQADGTYEVVGVDTAGARYDFAGTYVLDESTTPGSIVQTQTVPYDAVAAGLWLVEGDTLTLEVVQTSPDYGYTAATPDSGFGSTAGPGLEAGDNIQTYVRVD